MQPIFTLLPGLHGTAALYGPLVRLLDEHPVECIRYPHDIPQSYAHLTDWLCNTIDWSKPRILIAESFSGPLAINVAAKFPYSVQALVLAASFCASPSNPSLALLPLRPLMMLKPPLATIRHFLIGSDASAAEATQLRSIVSSIPAKVLSQRIRSILTLEASDCPSLPETPMLILQASNDNLVPWDSQNQLCMHYDHAVSHWLEAPHLILQKCPAQCHALISHFLSTIHPSASYA